MHTFQLLLTFHGPNQLMPGSISVHHQDTINYTSFTLIKSKANDTDH